MPHRVSYIPHVIDGLSTDRLRSYSQVFNTTNNIDLVGAYLWNANICANITPILSLIEVSLRNQLDKELILKYKTNLWWKKNILRYKSFTPGGNIPHAILMIRKCFSDSAKSVIRNKRNRYGISGYNPKHNDIVSNAVFSTWEFLLDEEFMGRTLLWPSGLSRVFLGEWTNNRASLFLTDMKERVKFIREIRNRIFHWEPIWKNSRIHNKESAIAYTLSIINKLEEFLNILNPEILKLASNSNLFLIARSSCSIDDLDRFQQNKKSKKITRRNLFDIIDNLSDRKIYINAHLYTRKKEV